MTVNFECEINCILISQIYVNQGYDLVLKAGEEVLH